ncbi:methyl-accepting chemotaxis protein [Vibrio parahaemolyticus]|uniref:methyl-accepting chemotaxis protein n=1 Tax=Vibrio parahaemolyticus TaxID=670 RepID=UPI00211A49B9|nr:methyl-accepting chemotaxis protein [Vibrio parahaemolyticus]
MSIKQSIAALVILLSVSFSAFSDLVKVSGKGVTSIAGCSVTIGSTISISAYFSCVDNAYVDGVIKACRPGSCNHGTSHKNSQSDGTLSTQVFYANGDWAGTVLVYYEEAPPPPPKYCELQSTINAIDEARTQCESSGKQFSYSCSDETESWESECNGGDCSKVEGDSGDMTWDSGVFGNGLPSSYMCSGKGGGCTASIDGSSAWCGESGWCYATFTVIGPSCDSTTGNLFCNDPECKTLKDPNTDDKPDTDPTHKPDDPTGGDIEDPSVLPDSDNDVVVPEPPTDEPDVEDPPTDESTDTAVVNAITGMNKDVNKALNDMNIDINQASADVQNQIIALNASVVTNTQAIQKQQANDNEIYRKTKALIQQANADITTAVNQNTNAINGVGDDVEKIAGAMDGIAEDVAGISDTLDGIANTDTSGAGIGGTCIETGTCTGFYESKYPEGLGGLVSGQLNDLKVNTIDNFVSSFGNLDLSNAQRPSFVLPVPFFGDFSFEEHISFDWVFGFVRAVLIMTSIFAARRIIFGG